VVGGGEGPRRQKPASAGHDDGPTLSSLSAASKASISSFRMVPLKAFSLSGRFSVMVRISLGDLAFDRLVGHGVSLALFFELLSRHSVQRAQRRLCAE
jgi:hypothetical protein